MSAVAPHPKTVVLRALTGIREGATFSINDLATELDAAGFTPAMRASAVKWMAKWVENTNWTVPVRAWPSAKGRRVSVYRLLRQPTRAEIEAAA